MDRLKRLMITLWYLELALTACKTTNPSLLKHDVGAWRAVVPNQEWAWSIMSRDDLMEHPFLKGTATSEPRTELERVLTILVTEVVGKLRQLDSERWGGLPTPEVFVIPNKELNAFVFTTNLCPDFTATFAEGTGILDAARFNRTKSEFTKHQPPDSCPTIKFASNDQAIDFINWQMERFFFCGITEGDCYAERRAGWSGGKAWFGAQFSGRCESHNLERVQQVNNVVFDRTANALVFHSKTIEQLPFEGLVFVILHELAHYTRSHMNALDPATESFYFIGERNPKTIPTSSAEAKVLGQRLFAARGQAAPFLDANRLGQTRVHPVLHHSLDRLRDLEPELMTCLDAPYPRQVLNPKAIEDPSATSRYLKDEEAFLSCMQTNRFGHDRAFPSAEAFLSALYANYKHFASPLFRLPGLEVGQPTDQ